jgi:hypothetical protein
MGAPKPSVLKRQRERKRAEKAALKRELRAQRGKERSGGGAQVATADDLAGYGVGGERDEDRRRR